MIRENSTDICENLEVLFEISSRCFDGIRTSNLTNCHSLLLISRLILIDCYIEKLFYPLAAALVVLGTILNLFSLYCFLKMNKRNSQNVYLSALSLGDTINLHINFTIPLLRQIDSIDSIFHDAPILCRINGFSTEFFLIFPTWIVVLLTFERLICILWPLKCYSLYTHKRAKISVVILACSVMCLCIYRFYDVKGIDQSSVFSITACEGESTGLMRFFRHLNLMIWAVLPTFVTFIMNLFIIYNIKLATQKFEPFYSKARQSKYNQATKIVLLISILFLICHTPTGILISLNLLYTTKERTIGLTIILVSRKITVILYEISLCCKFFIYNQTYRNFKDILHTSYSRFTRQTNSAKLGRPIVETKSLPNYHGKAIQFSHIKQTPIDYSKRTNKLSRQYRTSSIRDHQQQQQQNLLMTKMNDIFLEDTPILARRFTTDLRSSIGKNRLLWRTKHHITL